MLRRFLRTILRGTEPVGFEAFPALEWFDCSAAAHPAGTKSGVSESEILSALQGVTRSVQAGTSHAILSVYAAPDLYLTLSGHKSKGFAALHRDNGVESWWSAPDRSPDQVQALVRRFLSDPSGLTASGEWTDHNQ